MKEILFARNESATVHRKGPVYIVRIKGYEIKQTSNRYTAVKMLHEATADSWKLELAIEDAEQRAYGDTI